MRIRILFEPRDLWIGLFWDRPKRDAFEQTWKFYICVIPCFPILVTRTTWLAARRQSAQGGG